MFLRKMFDDFDAKMPHKFWTTFEKSWLLCKTGFQWLFEVMTNLQCFSWYIIGGGDGTQEGDRNELAHIYFRIFLSQNLRKKL